MNIATLRSSCLLTLLGLTTTALTPGCAFAQDNASQPEAKDPLIEKPTAPAKPPRPLTAGGGSGVYSPSTQDIERRVVEAAARAQDAARRGELVEARQEAQYKLAKPFSDLNAFSFTNATVRQSPGLIVTHELTQDEKIEWTEDLIVMDKLLRDKMSDIADDEQVLAMGIRVSVQIAPSPIYIDGCGALFTLSTSIPLAASGKATTAPTTREAMSAWERAKRDIGGRKRDVKPSAPPQFSQAIIDELTTSMSRTLLEATNMRHLAPEESVIITITGIDDAGAARRLTMKARKSDIDAASKNNEPVETFRKLVASNVN